ncbi:hypothetical protein JRQ81_006476 [Phrynocephalus forsythii]|uniref:Ig-like domain-containing protein n=1 Tax=Phrynocephalus forsythii TaxID=171643 RepID=A0A9Q1AUU7_9SAUR|nr:hypothetical protein JRQ81_006476 [Phrynocephalus forsythii]
MNLLPDKACLLPRLIFVVMFLGSTASLLISVIQEPSLINVTEGSTLNMECRDKRNFSGLWSIEWYKNKCLKEGKIQPSSQIVINKNELEKTSYFILKRAAIQDAGIYICCATDEAHKHVCSNGTHVVISEVTDLMVNQTPGDIEKEEGANITLECQFMPIGNLSYMYVRWYKNRTLLSKRAAEYTIKEDLEEGFTSLTLWKAAESDSETYTCEVGRADRNLNGSRREFRVAISEPENKSNPTKKGGTEHREKPTAGAGFETGIAAGAAVGVLLFLLLIAVFMWKQKKRGTPAAPPETESVANEAPRKHPPLAGQASDVTYADLHFHRRAQPESEVVYAEVRLGPKQRAGKNGQT